MNSEQDFAPASQSKSSLSTDPGNESNLNTKKKIAIKTARSTLKTEFHGFKKLYFMGPTQANYFHVSLKVFELGA